MFRYTIAGFLENVPISLRISVQNGAKNLTKISLGIIFFPVGTALVGFQAEYRDVLYLGEGVIVYTLRINRPVAAHLGATFWSQVRCSSQPLSS